MISDAQAQGSQTQLLHDPTLFELVRKKRWKEAWELVANNQMAPYNANINLFAGTIRLPLHELCKKVKCIQHLQDNDGFPSEFTDDEDEEMFSEEDLTNNQEMYKLARFMILQSQSLDAPVFHPGTMRDNEVILFGRNRSCLSLRDGNGNTPLHVLCAHSSDPTMMKIIFQCCSTETVPGEDSSKAIDLIKLQNEQDCTPLHFLSECTSPYSSLELMLEHCPNIGGTGLDPRLIPDVDGEVPAHWAFSSHASPRRLRAILSGCPESLLFVNNLGLMPMDECAELWENWDFLDDDEKRHLWMEMQEILKVVTGSQDDDAWSPLHAIASGVHFMPKAFWSIAIEFCEIDTYNSDGMLPLHVAVSTEPVEYGGGRLPLNADRERSLMREILFSSVDLAAWPTSQGRLALHLAAESKQPEWILCALTNAFPGALLTFDPFDGLPPSILAAADENNSVGVVFYLLRTDPSVLQMRA